MAAIKSPPISRLLALTVCLAIPLAGCAELNIWNDRVLDVFEPLGMGPEVQWSAEGPLMVVVQNLTRAATHGEKSDMGIQYTRTSGNGGIHVTIPAIPEPLRPDNEYYRETFVLNCKDVQTVTMDAEVTRVQITEEEEDGVFVAEEVTIYFASEGDQAYSRTFWVGDIRDREEVEAEGEIIIIGDTDDDEPLKTCKVERDEQGRLVTETVSSVRTFTEFQRDVHFECGSILVFAVTERRKETGAIDLQDRDCDYLFTPLSSEELKEVMGEDIVVFSSGLSPEEQQAIDNGLLDVYATQGEEALSEAEKDMIDDFKDRWDYIFDSYILDPGHFLLNRLYPYPNEYITLAISVPQATDIDLLTPILIEQAAQVSSKLEQ